jgi:tyrosyl-tRNA synthetase
MWSWWLLLTDLLPREIEALKQGHPMDAKKALAREIVGQFHGRAEAQAAEERWVKRFSERKTEDAPDVEVPPTVGEESLAKLLVERGMAGSRKEAERLIQQGAVTLDGAKVADPRLGISLASGTSLVVKAGKLKLQRWVVR